MACKSATPVQRRRRNEWRAWLAYHRCAASAGCSRALACHRDSPILTTLRAGAGAAGKSTRAHAQGKGQVPRVRCFGARGRVRQEGQAPWEVTTFLAPLSLASCRGRIAKAGRGAFSVPVHRQWLSGQPEGRLDAGCWGRGTDFARSHRRQRRVRGAAFHERLIGAAAPVVVQPPGREHSRTADAQPWQFA